MCSSAHRQKKNIISRKPKEPKMYQSRDNLVSANKAAAVNTSSKFQEGKSI